MKTFLRSFALAFVASLLGATTLAQHQGQVAPNIQNYSNNNQSVELSQAFLQMVPTTLGSNPINYTVQSGTLGAGLTLNSGNGKITQTGPASVQTWSATIRASNNIGHDDFVVGGEFRKDRVDFGVNLNFVNYFSRALVFTNLFTQSQQWKRTNNLAPPNDILDTNVPVIAAGNLGAGYPDFNHANIKGTGTPADPDFTVLSTVFASGTDMDGNKASPSGPYRLEWDGSGNVTIPEFGGTTSFGSNFKQWGTKQPSFFKVEITSCTNTSDPVRNIRVYPPKPGSNPAASYTSADDPPPPLFRPEVVDKLKEACHVNDLARGPIRFLDWDRVNEVGTGALMWNVESTFAASYLPTTAVRQSENPAHQQPPVAFEHMIDLCNAVGTDMWINVPHQNGCTSTEYATFCTGLANLIRTRLSSNLNVYVEWSNEVWNTLFPVYDWIAGLPNSHPSVTNDLYVAHVCTKMLEAYSPMKHEFTSNGAGSRFRFVVMGHIGNTTYLQKVINKLDSGLTVPSPLGGTFSVNSDVYGAGCSWYLRAENLDNWIDNDGTGPDVPHTKVEMYDDLQDTLAGTFTTKLGIIHDIVKSKGSNPKFILYEGGLSVGIIPHVQWRDEWWALHRDVLAYELYRDLFTVMRDENVDMSCHYGFIYKLDDSQGGTWQLLETEHQTPEAGGAGAAPKYDAWVEGPAGT